MNEKKRKLFLGIDLGTSAVKLLLSDKSGVIRKTRRTYDEPFPNGYLLAVKDALSGFLCNEEKTGLAGISISSQVGTYITDEGVVIGWWQSEGKDELDEICAEYSEDIMLREISMRHPPLVSYPLPRLSYIKKHYKNTKRVMMPKEYLILALTDNFVSDPYSYRGLYNFEKGELSRFFLDKIAPDISLPEIIMPTKIAGRITQSASDYFAIPKNIPVYCGMNDFFAGLLGMGVINEGDCFEISGTSEHVGTIRSTLGETGISGRYLSSYIQYGGTKSSGVACSLALSELSAGELPTDFEPSLATPVFLPYLNGERAPIYDENARGVFYGLNSDTNKAALGYSVLEGVVFSLYDIALDIGISEGGRLITSAGSSANPIMARIKAELFEKEILLCRETDTSAFGATMIAMIGDGEFKDYNEAIEALVKYDTIALPTGNKERYNKRFSTYRAIYNALKNEFPKLSL